MVDRGHDHERILQLAASAIDFELSGEEAAELEQGLAACGTCRRRATSMRATATRLTYRAPLDAPDRVRDVVVRAAAGYRAPARSRYPLLLVAAALTGLAVVGGVLVIGNERPSPIPTAAPIPSVADLATAAPTASPDDASSEPSPVAVEPFRAGAVGTVVADTPLTLRSAPGRGSDSAELTIEVHPDQPIVILGGPVSASGDVWYRVAIGADQGWVAATSRTGAPWLGATTNGLIAVVTADDRGGSLATIDGSGATKWRQDLDLEQIEHLAWSPDGSWLAFVARPDPDSAPEAYAIGSTGEDLRRLTFDGIEVDSIAWAPGELRLAIHYGDDEARIRTVDLEGTLGPVVAKGIGGSWSPEGRRIAYTKETGPAYQVWIVNVDGTEPRLVSPALVAGQRPAWSPDRLELAVLGTGEEGGCQGACVIERRTGVATRVGPATSVPSWSPDGRSLLVLDANADGLGVAILPADGGSTRPLPVPSGIEVDYVVDASWSPDGRSILVTYLADGATHLVSVPVDDGTPTHLDALPLTDRAVAAAWQPVITSASGQPGG